MLLGSPFSVPDPTSSDAASGDADGRQIAF
jgi:hypothetical protein